MAVWGAVLSVQDVPNGNDVIGIDPDHHGVHNRALSSDLSLAARSGYFRSVAGSARGCGRLGGGLCDGHPVPDKHAHLLLLAASSDRHAAGRLSYLHHSQPVDAQHEIRISGYYLSFSTLYAIIPAFVTFRTSLGPTVGGHA